MNDGWTDDELEDDFEAVMLGVEPGQPGPGMAESDRLVREMRCAALSGMMCFCGAHLNRIIPG